MFEDRLKTCLDTGRVLVQEPMKRHTTFRAGGPADYFVEPATEEELKKVMDLLREEQMPYYILGNGSNLLVSDQGYRGVIVSMLALKDCRVDGNLVYAGAGIKMSVLAREILAAGLTGFEFGAGIPGTLGGAVVMNAGAYGGEMVQILKSVRVMTMEGEVLDLPAAELKLSYRYSLVPEMGYIVLGAEMELVPGEQSEIHAKMDELAQKRRDKQPLEFPSAGSTFKRPEGYFAGKLIQDSGLAGYRVGGACVSPKHCGFVVNDQDGTASDIYQLCKEVEACVWERFGVKLTMEVKILGDFC
ncbi:MAG: UDP-N-acetylmuramate dehydrogenase [Lachnospiraceae bacterium]|nr:UDP-N-acetylmuramate dehydrogenase [Lachnospiraceae bacterium]